MTAMETMRKEWQIAFDEMNSSDVMKRIREGKIELSHYKAILRQIFHHARENPQIQAAVTMYFKGDDRDTVKMFFKHATSEIGHDMLALGDLERCGEDVSQIPTERPLPATTALLGFPMYQAQYKNAIGYLGYLFFLEYTPTQGGGKYMDAFRAIGASDEALTFIEEHATVDVGHCKLMEKYVEQLVQTPEDLSEVCYAIRVTGNLYTRMIEEAVASVDKKAKSFGASPLEVKRTVLKQAKEFQAA